MEKVTATPVGGCSEMRASTFARIVDARVKNESRAGRLLLEVDDDGDDLPANPPRHNSFLVAFRPVGGSSLFRIERAARYTHGSLRRNECYPPPRTRFGRVVFLRACGGWLTNTADANTPVIYDVEKYRRPIYRTRHEHVPPITRVNDHNAHTVYVYIFTDRSRSCGIRN